MARGLLQGVSSYLDVTGSPTNIYRYFELHINQSATTARYFGMPTIVNRNDGEISLANFTVQSGANHLQRFAGSVASSPVENGFVKFGHVNPTNLTNHTSSGQFYISHDNEEDI